MSFAREVLAAREALEKPKAQPKQHNFYGSTPPMGRSFKPVIKSRTNTKIIVEEEEEDDDAITCNINCGRERLRQMTRWIAYVMLLGLAIFVLVVNRKTLLDKFSMPHIFTSGTTKSTHRGDSSGFIVTSPAFEANGTLPDKYTCKFGTETGVSPPLAWSNPPEGAEDFMITMKKESGYSWTVYDLGTLDHVDEATSNAATSGATVGEVAGTEAWDIDVPPYISTAGYVSMYKYEEPCSKGPGYKWYLFTVYAFSEHAAAIMKGHGFSKSDTKPTKILELMTDEGYLLGQAQIIVYYSLYGDEETETTTTTTTTATVTAPAGGGGAPPAAGGAPAVPGGAGAVAAPPGGGAPAPRIPAAGVAGGAVATVGGTGAAAASAPPAA